MVGQRCLPPHLHDYDGDSDGDGDDAADLGNYVDVGDIEIDGDGDEDDYGQEWLWITRNYDDGDENDGIDG